MASSASASTITETFAGHGPTGPLELQLSETINQPASVTHGQNMTISVPSSSQVVPTSQMGIPVNYIAGLQTLIPVPPQATFAGNIVAGNWTFTPAGGGTPTTGPLTVTECTAAGVGCTATAPSSTFLGPGTSTPYVEATTGAAHFPGGGTLSLPGWSFDVTASGTGTIQSTVSEFDTTADINLAGTAISIALATYPAVPVSGCLTTGGSCTTQPAYQFQPIASTTITSSGDTTTTAPGATTTTTGATTTTTTPGSTTTTTTATGTGSSTGTTTTTVQGTTTGLGSGSATAINGGVTVVAGTGASTGGSCSGSTSSGGASSGSTGQGASVAAGSSQTSSASRGNLAYTGPPKTLWLLGLIAFGLLDLGYLALSATWRARRSRLTTSD